MVDLITINFAEHDHEVLLAIQDSVLMLLLLGVNYEV